MHIFVELLFRPYESRYVYLINRILCSYSVKSQGETIHLYSPSNGTHNPGFKWPKSFNVGDNVSKTFLEGHGYRKDTHDSGRCFQ